MNDVTLIIILIGGILLWAWISITTNDKKIESLESKGGLHSALNDWIQFAKKLNLEIRDSPLFTVLIIYKFKTSNFFTDHNSYHLSITFEEDAVTLSGSIFYYHRPGFNKAKKYHCKINCPESVAESFYFFILNELLKTTDSHLARFLSHDELNYIASYKLNNYNQKKYNFHSM